jgi:hypothetical protein
MSIAISFEFEVPNAFYIGWCRSSRPDVHGLMPGKPPVLLAGHWTLPYSDCEL